MVETAQRRARPLDEEDPDRARHWALTAFLLLFLSLFTAWYVVHHDSHEFPTIHQTHKIAPFDDAVVGEWGPLVTGILVIAAMVNLLWGWMAAQWQSEPDKWRRDIWTAFVLSAGAVASIIVWVPDGGTLWGSFSLSGHDGLAAPTEVAVRLGLGWFAALGATAALLVAGVFSRQHNPETYEEPVPHEAHPADSEEE